MQGAVLYGPRDVRFEEGDVPIEVVGNTGKPSSEKAGVGGFNSVPGHHQIKNLPKVHKHLAPTKCASFVTIL